MTLDEKVKIIEEGKEKDYLFISPRIIKPGAKLVENYETLNLYVVYLTSPKSSLVSLVEKSSITAESFRISVVFL